MVSEMAYMVGFRWLQLHLRPWAQFLYILAAPTRVPTQWEILGTGILTHLKLDFRVTAIFCSSACAVSVRLHACLLSSLAFSVQPSLHTCVLLPMLSCSSVEWMDKGQQSVPFHTKAEVLVHGHSPEKCIHMQSRENGMRKGSFLTAPTATVLGKI